MRLLSVISVALLLFVSLPPVALGADPVPCTCLQELWVDYPGPNDLYFSLNHITSCDDEGEEGLWYGFPSNGSLPQICDYGNCEAYQEADRGTAAIFPGHGQELVGAKAWDVLRVGLESAVRKTPGLEVGSPIYHVIPSKDLPAKLKAKRDMIVMAIPINVHVKGSRYDGNSYYFGIQIDSADGLSITKVAFEDIKLGRGSQLSVKYRAKSGEVRKGLVWLK